MIMVVLFLVVGCGGEVTVGSTVPESYPRPLPVEVEPTDPVGSSVTSPVVGSLPSSASPLQYQFQSLDLVTLDGGGVGVVAVFDEGAGFAVSIFANEGVVTDVVLRDKDGNVIAPLEKGFAGGEFGFQLAATFPGGGSGGQLTVIGLPGEEVGIVMSVASEVVASAEANPLEDGTVEIVVTLTGPEPLVADEHTVVAYVGNGPHGVPVAVPFYRESGGVLTFRAVIEAESGEFQPVDIEISGTHTRYVSTGFAVPPLTVPN